MDGWVQTAHHPTTTHTYIHNIHPTDAANAPPNCGAKRTNVERRSSGRRKLSLFTLEAEGRLLGGGHMRWRSRAKALMRAFVCLFVCVGVFGASDNRTAGVGCCCCCRM